MTHSVAIDRRGLIAVALGLAVTLLLAAIKIAAGVLGNSYALIADGVESLADVFGTGMVLGGLLWASRPADAEHPYGHGKAEGVAAITVAFMLVVTALGLAIQSVREIIIPHHAPEPFTLVVLVGVIVAKLAMAGWLRRLAGSTTSTALAAEGQHHASDAITSAAAFVGITIALILGPGYEAADDWAALLACAIIFWNGLRIGRRGIDEVMDVSVDAAARKRVVELAQGTPGVEAVETCRIRKSGQVLHVDLHVEVNGELTVKQGHRIAHAVKDAVLLSELNVHDVMVHVEPQAQGRSGEHAESSADDGQRR